MQRPSVFLVQHANELESICGTCGITVLGFSAPARDFEVFSGNTLCDAYIAARIADHSAVLVIDSCDKTARRDLFTFVGSIPVRLRSRIVVLANSDGDVGVWQDMHLRVVDSASALRDIIEQGTDGIGYDAVAM